MDRRQARGKTSSVRVVGFIGNALLWLGIARAWTACTKACSDRQPPEP